MFARIDANKDGAITLAELSAAPRPAKPAMAKAGHRGLGMLQAADTNKDGKISLAEIQTAAFRQFDRADTNHDGTVTPQERKAEFKTLRAQRKAS
jgi:Ca2+-binding EF-hand superfamily protein